MNIPISKPIIGDEEISAVVNVLKSGKLASGTQVQRFEIEFADYCGTKYAVATNNGTSALHATLIAAGIGKYDEVIIPSFSFIATASSVSMTGAKPIFVDVDNFTYNINPCKILDKITPRTKAILGVHLFGQPFDVKSIRDICEDYGLILIEDAAQAHGAMVNNKKVGSFGTMGCFSFYATKNMMTGEGGMITTNDKKLNERLRKIINHGQTEKYLHTFLGYNYRMTDISAALGIEQLKKLNKFNNARRENAHYYDGHIHWASGVDIPLTIPENYHVYHQYALRVTHNCSMTRPNFIKYLTEKGIGSAVHYPLAIHNQPLYYNRGFDTCPVSTSLSSSLVSIPVHPSLTDNEVAYISAVINNLGN